MIILAIVCGLLALFATYVAFEGGLTQVARARLYKSGTRWCFWRWTDVESEYILRLHIFKAPFGAVCLHWIRKPDREPWLHDHPVSFLSIVLRGGYAEIRGNRWKQTGYNVCRWFNFIRATPNCTHRIVYARKHTLTLCFMGPKVREWGFHVPNYIKEGGWIGWQPLRGDQCRRRRDGAPLRSDLRHDAPAG